MRALAWILRSCTLDLTLMGIFSSWRHIAPVLRRQFRWERVAISRSAADILEQSLGGRLRKYDQEAQPPPRGARYPDQGEYIDHHAYNDLV